jgi:hypothetical protein
MFLEKALGSIREGRRKILVVAAVPNSERENMWGWG